MHFVEVAPAVHMGESLFWNWRTQELTKWAPPLLYVELQELPCGNSLQQHTPNDQHRDTQLGTGRHGGPHSVRDLLCAPVDCNGVRIEGLE